MPFLLQPSHSLRHQGSPWWLREATRICTGICRTVNPHPKSFSFLTLNMRK
ncbi:hypothetical protein EXN66_Car000876 [Channa argus]|uniref:Uncharacterized protein n=1 Tax=Channa argus TaxID=215402 RepID=A0A6G1QZE8_CHAAH|nr:hypothetical protein EXN66_Car000876 [Channa argus]